MNALADIKHSHNPRLEYGRIRCSAGGRFTVDTALSEIKATRAASCLMEPRPGDAVIVFIDVSGRNFVLAVLERSPEGDPSTDLRFDGPVNVHIEKGDLTLTSEGSMTLAPQGVLSCVSDRMKIHAEDCSAKVNRFQYTGRLLQIQVKCLKMVAVFADQIFRRLTQRLESSFRFVKGQDELQAGSSRVLVEDLMTMHAKNSLIVAEENVTVNAEQIHLG